MESFIAKKVEIRSYVALNQVSLPEITPRLRTKTTDLDHPSYILEKQRP